MTFIFFCAFLWLVIRKAEGWLCESGRNSRLSAFGRPALSLGIGLLSLLLKADFRLAFVLVGFRWGETGVPTAAGFRLSDKTVLGM